MMKDENRLQTEGVLADSFEKVDEIIIQRIEKGQILIFLIVKGEGTCFQNVSPLSFSQLKNRMSFPSISDSN